MATNPFGGLGNTPSNSGFGGMPRSTYTPPKPRKKKKINKAAIVALLESNAPKEQKALGLVSAGFTPRQAATALAAFESQGHRSFGDKLKGVGKGALGGATWTLDKLMRPSWAVSSAVDEAWDERDEGNVGLSDLKDVAEAAKRGFTGKERKGFGEVLGEHGVLKGHRRLRGVTGFGLDVATDPLMLLSLAAAPVTGGASVAAYAAAKSAGRAVAPKLLKEAAQEAGQKALKGATDDLTEELLVAGGERYASRLAHLRLKKANEQNPIIGLSHEDAVAAKALEDITSSVAFKEAGLYDAKRVYLKYGTRKHNVRVPLAPALSRPGQKVVKSGIPVISQLTDSLGRAFKPDWKNPLVRSGQVARQHVAEQNTNMQRQLIGKIFDGVDETMDVDHFLTGLHYMEQPLKTTRGGAWKAVLPTKEGGFKLNKQYMDLLERKGLIDHSQRDAIQRYFQATQAMLRFDRAAGVAVKDFSETGRFYVPHVMLKDGESAVPTISQRNLLTEAGFQKNRKGATLSIKQIKQMVDEGQLPRDLETNPFRLLAHRSRAGAERQADMALVNTLKATVGVPMRLVNEKSVARATARQKAAIAKLEGATRAAAHAEDDYDKAVQKVKDQLVDVQTQAEKAFAKSSAALRQKAKAAEIEKLQGQIKRARKPERKAELEAQLRKVKAARVTTPAIVRQNAKMLGLRKKLDDALKAMDNPRTTTHKEAVSEPLLAHTTAKSALKDAKAELKAANKQYKKAVEGKANKAVKPGLQVDSRATDKWGNPIAFPQEAAQGFLRLERIVSGDDSTIDNFVRTFGKWQGVWKVIVTIMNPGYRVRNTMTDMWNMWLAGSGPVAVQKYGIKAARTMKAASNGEPAAFGWVQEAANHGILAGIFAGDIARVEKYFKYGGKTARALRKDHEYISLTTKIMQDFNKSAENWGRMTHYMWRRQGLGESAGEAAQKVKMAHFDYEDLTPFEQKIRDTIFPFYTWTRKNIPYQVQMIFKEPGRYSAFPKLAQEMSYVANTDPNTPVPEHVETGMGIPIGGGKYYMPQFGVSDLMVFQNAKEPFDRAASMLSPAIKTPLELYQNKSLFTGQPIDDGRHPRAPVTPLGAGLLGMIPGSNVGPTSRNGIAGPGANPYYAYLLGQLPGTRVAGVTGPGSIQSKRSGDSALKSWGLGIATAQSDPQQEAYYQSIAIQEEVDKMLQGLRDETNQSGVKRKKSETVKFIESILGGDYG